MKERTKGILKQLLEIIRFILFIPAGFIAGTIVKFPLLLLGRIKESLLTSNVDNLLTDLWQTVQSLQIFGETQIWQTLIFYLVCFYASFFIKPKFLSSKYFILAWSLILSFNVFISISELSNPKHSTRLSIIIDALSPVGVLIYLIKDKRNNFLKLNQSN